MLIRVRLLQLRALSDVNMFDEALLLLRSFLTGSYLSDAAFRKLGVTRHDIEQQVPKFQLLSWGHGVDVIYALCVMPVPSVFQTLFDRELSVWLEVHRVAFLSNFIRCLRFAGPVLIDDEKLTNTNEQHFISTYEQEEKLYELCVGKSTEILKILDQHPDSILSTSLHQISDTILQVSDIIDATRSTFLIKKCIRLIQNKKKDQCNFSARQWILLHVRYVKLNVDLENLKITSALFEETKRECETFGANSAYIDMKTICNQKIEDKELDALSHKQQRIICEIMGDKLSSAHYYTIAISRKVSCPVFSKGECGDSIDNWKHHWLLLKKLYLDNSESLEGLRSIYEHSFFGGLVPLNIAVLALDLLVAADPESFKNSIDLLRLLSSYLDVDYVSQFNVLRTMIQRCFEKHLEENQVGYFYAFASLARGLKSLDKFAQQPNEPNSTVDNVVKSFDLRDYVTMMNKIWIVEGRTRYLSNHRSQIRENRLIVDLFHPSVVDQALHSNVQMFAKIFLGIIWNSSVVSVNRSGRIIYQLSPNSGTVSLAITVNDIATLLPVLRNFIYSLMRHDRDELENTYKKVCNDIRIKVDVGKKLLEVR